MEATMKYTGPNAEGFHREARILLGFFADKPEGFRDYDYDKSFEDWAHDLADAFHIAHTDIWDILPEYETEATE
jgi:hypothetical protein